MASTRAKFGYLNYDAMLNNLAQETNPKKKLDAYDINFAPDTKECYIIAPDLTPWAIKSKVYTFDSVEDALNGLNTNTDTYAGQIVAILHDDKYYGYMVNVASGNSFSVSPLSEYIGNIDYNTLGNRPINNIVGEIGKTILISDLSDGVYSVTGQYQISSELSTIYSSSSQVLFLVERDQDHLYIKKITAKDITNYTIINAEVFEETYITDQYLTDNDYATTDYVNSQIAALDFITRNEAEEYVSQVISDSLDTILDEKIEEQLNAKLVPIEDTAIESLFTQ